MQRRRFLGLLAACMVPIKTPSAPLPNLVPVVGGALDSAGSTHLFKMLLNHLGTRALLAPDDAIIEFEHAIKTNTYVKTESIIAQAFLPDPDLVAKAVKLSQDRPSVQGMTDILNGLQHEDPEYYSSLFAEALPKDIALRFDQQLARGKQGISELLEDFDNRLKKATREELNEIEKQHNAELEKKPNFSDMAAARKAGGYPIPANYTPDERARTRIGTHKTALGENTWIDRLSEPSTGSSLKR